MWGYFYKFIHWKGLLHTNGCTHIHQHLVSSVGFTLSTKCVHKKNIHCTKAPIRRCIFAWKSTRRSSSLTKNTYARSVRRFTLFYLNPHSHPNHHQCWANMFDNVCFSGSRGNWANKFKVFSGRKRFRKNCSGVKERRLFWRWHSLQWNLFPAEIEIDLMIADLVFGNCLDRFCFKVFSLSKLL